MVVFGQSGCVREKWVFSGKIVLFGKNRLFFAMWLYAGKSGCIKEIGCIRAIVDVFR